ncbi:glycosyl hydrolase family 2 [Curtobacterium sp. PhB130]|uniref:glycoside hydrolase family 2 protein n=1 Tax=unclassified Curtobacterium TaxID=257496 RepID=UPI000F9932EB|nr:MULTISPECIES: sugar-binding domain-containing protein [unclassified Curtobacterium]ROS71848.1 glycosyl hydrolase family 2 [Curtobacterium sp. PhB130]TCK58242.1 glycosyl hydrolase family 2 [Curtobacterium sp. PhB136]
MSLKIPAIPKPEHPRPQLVRDDWVNLNGVWGFEVDPGDSGLERGLRDRELSGEVLVPFAPESKLSGVENVDFMHAVWYRRTVTIPAEWRGKRALLHFGAVDHDCTVWVNDTEVVRHRGGFTSFTADLHAVAQPGEQATIVVRARDPRSGPQARGKQSVPFGNASCNYTRTTGIWQTVWLEAVPDVRILVPRITPSLSDGSLTVEVPLSANRPDDTVRVVISDAEGTVVSQEVAAHLDLVPAARLVIPPARLRLWSPDDPHLYDVVLELLDGAGTVLDSVRSYAGVRSIAIDGQRLLLNGEPVFQRLVLDQGYYPDSLMTSPDDESLIRDIELGLAAGFNGARLHQKVFEERFLFHADRLGYLVWGEFGDWGSGGYGDPDDSQQPTASFVAQWLEALERDYNHPAIVGWCPLNESQQVITDHIRQLDDVTLAMYNATKLADRTRPVVDASGYSHRVPGSDVYDSHNYEQDPVEFARQMEGLDQGRAYTNVNDDGRPISVPYAGQPYFCSEFGGIWWNPEAAAESASAPETDVDRERSWGYGALPGSEEVLQQRFAGLVGVLLDDARMFGYCYTQLTDVFQEQNGIYRFDRSEKLDVSRIRAAQLRNGSSGV